MYPRKKMAGASSRKIPPWDRASVTAILGTGAGEGAGSAEVWPRGLFCLDILDIQMHLSKNIGRKRGATLPGSSWMYNQPRTIA